MGRDGGIEKKNKCESRIWEPLLWTLNICLLELHYFLEVDMKYLKTRLYKTKKNLGTLRISADNIHIGSSFCTVYS